MEMQKRGFEKS